MGIYKVHVIAALIERALRLRWIQSLTSGTFFRTKGAEWRQSDITEGFGR